MSRRIYFLAPNPASVHAITDELQTMDIPERHIHVIGSYRYALDDLPQATLLQKSDLAHGVEWGVGVGGTAGLLGGLLAVTFPPAGLVLGGGAILMGTLVGAGFGALVSGMVAADQPNHDLESFEEDIMNGEILVLVDVPFRRLDEIKDVIIKHHPEAHIGVAHPPSS